MKSLILNPAPRVEFPIILFDVDIRVLKLKMKAIRGALGEATNGLIVWGIYVHKSKRN